MTVVDEPFEWQVRSFAYRVTAARGIPPRPEEIAAAFGVSLPDAQDALERLHRAHAVFLDPDTRAIRMLNPFSAIPTDFHVRANGRSYWANCAWDALGISAALGEDAVIEARSDGASSPMVIEVKEGEVHGNGEITHFVQPFRRWYDDLIAT